MPIKPGKRKKKARKKTSKPKRQGLKVVKPQVRKAGKPEAVNVGGDWKDIIKKVISKKYPGTEWT